VAKLSSTLGPAQQILSESFSHILVENFDRDSPSPGHIDGLIDNPDLSGAEVSSQDKISRNPLSQIGIVLIALVNSGE
jgi:hypothetical protein